VLSKKTSIEKQRPGGSTRSITGSLSFYPPRHRQEDGSTALLPARRVMDRYGICARTLDRWVKDESIGFPKPIVVRRRRYWRVGELAAFERRGR
jgi:hypothetical protein